MKTPRCPACRAWLDGTRLVDETMTREGGVWISRLACPGCLSIVGLRRLEVGKGRPIEATASLAVPGAFVARALARLESAPDPDALREEIAAIRGGEDRWLLRVPEIFDAIRPAFTARARLAVDAFFISADPMTEMRIEPSGRIELRELSPQTVEGVDVLERALARLNSNRESALASPHAFFLTGGVMAVPAGLVLPVLAIADARFDLGAAPLALGKVSALVAPADLLAPVD